jgi:hypothetical protein
MVMVRGPQKVDQLLTLTMAAYNLTRLRSLAQVGRSARNASERSRNYRKTHR